MGVIVGFLAGVLVTLMATGRQVSQANKRTEIANERADMFKRIGYSSMYNYRRKR